MFKHVQTHFLKVVHVGMSPIRILVAGLELDRKQIFCQQRMNIESKEFCSNLMHMMMQATPRPNLPRWRWRAIKSEGSR
jgi:hypothetical protein